MTQSGNVRRWSVQVSAAEVVSPEFLKTYRPDRVIMMNAVYREEIAATLAGFGLSPTLVAA